VEETLQSELQNIYSMCATGLSLPGTKLIKKILLEIKYGLTENMKK